MTFEIARRLVKQGDSVEWFSAMFPGALPEETLEGVRIVRAGRQWSVHIHAFRRYSGKLSRNFDVVVDEVNTIPFFTPIWADIPLVMFIHQLAREVWWYESPFPINMIGYVSEPAYLKCYRRSPVLTVSDSTYQDLQALGFVGPVSIIPEGIEPIIESTATKGTSPRILYVGRLSPSKRVADVIRGFAMFSENASDATLALLGEGKASYVAKLHDLAASLGVSDRVQFAGRVSAAVKHQEMKGAHILAVTSVREGWGLVVIEANACGTPVIAYDVPGLRDAVRDRHTGLLVRPTPSALADAMVTLWKDTATYELLANAAREWSKTFSFDRTAIRFRSGLEAAVAAKSMQTRADAGAPSDRVL